MTSLARGTPRSAGLGYALVAIAACSWGTWPLILRHASMPASLQSAIVMGVLTVVSAPFMLKDRLAVRATPRDWLGVVWLGVSDAANMALFFAAYQRTSVAIAVLTHYLAPIFVALTAPFVLKERASTKTYGAVAIAFTGLVLLLEPWRAAANGIAGAALGAGSAVFYASNVLTNKRLAKVFSGSELMFFHGLVSVPILFALVPSSQYAQVEAGPLVVVLAGALGPGALAGLFFVWGLRRIPASHAGTLSLFEPLVAVLVAGALMGERVGGIGVVGGLLILAGALLVISAERKLS